VNWKRKHLTSIKQNYSKAPFFRKYIDIFEEAYSREWTHLIDIDMVFIFKLAECLGMNSKKIIRSSTLDIKGDRTEKLIRIFKALKADTFYEGSSGVRYIDGDCFEKHGIHVVYQNYRHPVYKQFSGDFIPYLSVIDLLFNHGEESLSILTSNISSEANGI
jgi:hypothetical protein